MNVVAPLPPTDLAQVQARLASVEAQNQALRTENQLLRDKIQALLRRYFGSPKNESLDPAQLQLLLSGLVPLVPAPAPQPPATPTGSTRTSANRQPARRGIPEDLPIVREVLLPEEVKANPEAFRQIEEVITKELDWEAAKFYWRHIVRPKFVRKEPAPLPTPSQQKATAVGKQLAAMAIDDPPEVFIAALPARLIEKGLPGVGLLVHLLLSRFEDHLPYYRLEKIFRERHGVPIARQSMVDWTEQLATWLQPIYREMKAESFACGYLQADETPVRYLDRDEPGRSCQGYLWAFGHPRGNVLFEWRTSRGRDGPEEFLKDFKGKLQTDGYAAYSSLVRERNAPLLAQGKEPELILFACWAHYPKSAIIRSGEGVGAVGRPEGCWCTPDNSGGSQSSERLEEPEQTGTGTPAFRFLGVEPGSFPEPAEHFFLHGEVALQITAGARDGRMAQIVTDHCQLDARLKQSNGATMAQQVRVDRELGERGVPLLRPAVAASQHVRDAVARERLTAKVEKDEAFRSSSAALSKLTQQTRGLLPQGTEPVAAPFAMQSHLSRSLRGEVTPSQLQSFTHAGSGVIEEEKQRRIPHAPPVLWRDFIQNESKLLRLQVVGEGLVAASFCRQRQDASVLVGRSWVMPQEVLHPGMQGGQTAVAGDGAIASLTLQVHQKVQDSLNGDIGQRQPVDSSMGLLSQERKEQSQRIPIGP